MAKTKNNARQDIRRDRARGGWTTCKQGCRIMNDYKGRPGLCKHSLKRRYNWVYQLQNQTSGYPTIAELTFIKKLTGRTAASQAYRKRLNIRYVGFQTEKGTHFHLQGYMAFSVAKRVLGTIMQQMEPAFFWKGIHWSLSDDEGKSIAYIKKSRTKVANGLSVYQGKATQSARLFETKVTQNGIVSKLQEGHTIDDLLNSEAKGEVALHLHAYQKIREMTMSKQIGRVKKNFRVFVLYGESGCGKSDWCNNHPMMESSFSVPQPTPGSAHQWWEGYLDQLTADMQEYNSSWYSMEQWKTMFDKNVRLIESKGRSMKNFVHTFVLTTNFAPEHWYNGVQMAIQGKEPGWQQKRIGLRAIQRRIRDYFTFIDVKKTCQCHYPVNQRHPCTCGHFNTFRERVYAQNSQFRFKPKECFDFSTDKAFAYVPNKRYTSRKWNLGTWEEQVSDNIDTDSDDMGDEDDEEDDDLMQQGINMSRAQGVSERIKAIKERMSQQDTPQDGNYEDSDEEMEDEDD